MRMTAFDCRNIHFTQDLRLNTVKQHDNLTFLDRRVLRKCDGESVELGGQVLDGARHPRPLARDHANLLAVLFVP